MTFSLLNCSVSPPLHHSLPFPFTNEHCRHLSQLPATAGWPQTFGWFRFFDTIWCPWYVVAFTEHKGIEYSEKAWNLELDLGWILTFPFTQHLSLQFSYHLGLFLLICKGRAINFYLYGYWGDYEKMSSRYTAQFLWGWFLVLNGCQCVVPRIIQCRVTEHFRCNIRW